MLEPRARKGSEDHSAFQRRQGDANESKAMVVTASEQARKACRRLVVLFAAVTLLGILALSGEAQAHDHEIPRTVLKKGTTGSQAGTRVIESSWAYPEEDGVCASETAIYTYRYPEVDRVAPGRELRVRVFKVQRPDAFEIDAYPRVDEAGRPAGQRLRLRSHLEPVVRDGRTVAWDVAFSLARPDRHYYLIGGGRWQDRQGCGLDQYAYWSFHVKTGAGSTSAGLTGV